MPDVGVLIPLARDRYRNLIPPDEASDHEFYYCPNCGEEVFPRKGSERQHHFAHRPNNPKTRDCELRADAWGRELLLQRRTPEMEAILRGHRLRLRVRRHPYLSALELLAVLPVVLPGEWDAFSSAATGITSKGTRGTLSPGLFHPSLGEAEIELDPRAPLFEIEIAGTTASVEGRWQANWSQPWPAFVGSDFQADARASLGNLRLGETIYIPDSPAIEKVGGEPLQLGGISYRALRVSKEMVSSLDSVIGPVGIATRGFDVSVVLPALQSPSDLVNIRSPPDSEVVLMVTPSSDLTIDPPIDVIELPSTTHRAEVVLPAGAGKPREWSFTLAPGQLRRFDFQWSGRHVFVQAFGGPPAIGSRKLEDVRVGLTLPDLGNKLVLASFESPPPERIPSLRGKGPAAKHFVVNSPVGLQVDVVFTTVDQSGRTFHEARRQVDVAELPDVLGRLSYNGAQDVVVTFGLFGLVNLEFPRLAQSTFTKEELRNRVLQLGLPSHVDWRYLRALLSIPEKTRHRELHGGVKKKVRKIVIDFRKSGECPKKWSEDS